MRDNKQRAPKGMAVRHLKRYASWVQTVQCAIRINELHTNLRIECICILFVSFAYIRIFVSCYVHSESSEELFESFRFIK